MHNLKENDTINLKLTYKDSNNSTITAVGTGSIHSDTFIKPDKLNHKIRLVNVNFTSLNISGAEFVIKPESKQIYITCSQLLDSYSQPITDIKISMDITEENVYNTINSNFIGADIARTADIPTKTSQLTNDSNFVTSTELATKQDIISDLDTIRSGAEAGATAVQPLILSVELDTKQDVISDLATIRSGAEAGATAVQPAALSEYAKTSELATVATSGSYNDLTDKPIFTYKSDVIKDSSKVIKTIYGGSHVKFINAGAPGSINNHIIDLSLPELT